MKRNLTFLLTALLLLTGMNVWAQSRTSITDVLNRELTGVTGSSYTSWEGKTSNSEAVYAGQSAGGNESIQLRSSNNNSGIITTASGGTVTSIIVTWNTNTADGRTLNVYGNHSAYTSPTELYNEDTNGTLLGTIVKGTSTELEITGTYEYLGLRSAGGAMYLEQIDITWETGGSVPPTPTVATPTFTPAAGTYYEPQTVSLACTTEGATIFYSLTSEAGQWMVFTTPITINETTTIWAYAEKEGCNDSPVISATYTISNAPSVITIAEARALANNEYALVQGVVTFIDNRNVYIQDETAGIDLFLNSNTVPSNLAIGDNVRAYGKHAVYNGLVELSGINGGNAEEFSILSSGNTLPLAVKTIAEVLEGGADALQCTRVKIESATIGAINTNSNTPLTQDEATINIYKVPALTGIEEGDVVDVISIVGYFNVPQLRVALASDVVLSETPIIPDPQLTVSTSLLENFSYVYGSGPSTPKNFTLSGSDLTTNVSLTAPQDFEISLSSSNGYANSLELSPIDGTLTETTVYVRLKAELNAGTYSGNLAIVSGELSHSITLNGTVDEMSIVTVTIAEARALENGQYAQVEGTVIFIDARNIYIQDETAGIDLFLNSNTVPTNLAIGDNIRAYGKHAVYNGLVELSGINGGNADEFSILSSGNTLPLAVKTIAEVLEGGADALQCTRVKIESATIGAINTSGNTPLTQDGTTINIYKVPALTDIEEGDVVDVVSVVGYFNVPQLRVALASDVVLSETPITPYPQLTVSVSELNGFDYNYGAGPSEIQSFEISGENLTNNVTVSPSENFEVSILPGDLFQPENPALLYIPESGSLSGFMIYVRLKTGLEAGTYNEQIAIASEGAQTLYVSVAGSVIGDGPTPPPTPTEGEYVRISDLSQLVEGSYVVIAARFDENASDYYAMTNASSGKPTGVLFTSANSDANEVLPASITDEESNYYWVVGMTDNGYTFTNAAGQMIGYESSTNFSTGGNNTEWAIELGTADNGSMVPNYSGFFITNVNNELRHFALNSNHNFGPYHSNNLTNSGYNFFLDLFVKTEGIEPPTHTVATPTFTPDSGTYYEIQNVSIACATDGATIYYSTVAENGPWTAYTEAITVDQNTTIWAYAEKEGYNDSPVYSATYIIRLGVVTIFSQDWEGEMNGWTFVTVEGNKPWNVSQYQGNHYAYANGYNGGVNEQWCISPGFNIHDYENVMLSFRNAKNFNGPDLELKYSTNYDGVDPTTASWWTFDFNMSPGSYTWVESGDIPISIYPYPAHDCYIAFKYTSTENEAAAWEVDDIILTGSTSVPNLTATPSSLSGFTHIVGEGPSESQYFTLSGVNIGPAPGGGSTGSIIMQVLSNEFEISLDNETFSWQVNIDGINGTLPPTPVYVRMNGAEVGQYTATVTIHASSSDQASVALSGTVTEPPVPGDDYVRISDMSQLVAGNRIVFAARFDENATDYYAMSSTATGHPTGVLFTSTLNGSEEILPASILAEEDNFYWTVNVTADGYTFTNAVGEMVGYTSSTNFSPNGDNTAWDIAIGTSEATAMVPNYTGFVISNVNTPVRAFALNGSHNFGPYHTQNMTGENYNFFLDIFMQGEGGVPPTPTVAAPIFDPAGGTYYEAQNVTISCATPDATVYYSLVPEPYEWIEYEETITVEENMTIWAYAEKDGYNDSPVVSAEYIIQDDIIIIFNQDWENGWQGWAEVCVTGDSLWRIASYQGNHYAYANGYNHPASEDWLISPAFDLDSTSGEVLSFRTAMNYNGPDITVLFSNEYNDGEDPSLSTWEMLPCELSSGSWNWVSFETSLDEFTGTNCHIAFKYTCTGDEAAGWEVDDIMLSSGGSSTDPFLIATPNALSGFSHILNQGPSDHQTFNLTGGNFLPLIGGGYGCVVLTLSNNSAFEISLDGEEYSPAIYIDIDENITLDTTVYVRLWGEEVGQYSDSILITEPDGFYINVALTGQVLSADQPSMSVLMPLYIQGNNGSNNNRVPMAAPAYFMNLEPNTTYRYTNQFVDENDGPDTAGAGNVIYANPEGFYRSTSPSLATEGGYGEFTTDEYGRALLVWLLNEPTANARFTPGNHVYLRVRINDGHDGTTVNNVFTSDYYATVLNFGNEYDEYQGTAFYVKSNEAPMSFALMFGSSNDGRPVYSTSIETIGVDFGGINQYADFYKEEVAGNDGWFGGILPNDNETGINFIQTVDLYDQNGNQYFTQDGHWNPNANTVNPTNGLDEPIFIDLTDDGVEEAVIANVKVWSADHEFVIENGDNAHYSMTVYNILGQPVMMKQINAGSTERISHSLTTGVYIISLQNNQSNVSVKVIVK